MRFRRIVVRALLLTLVFYSMVRGDRILLKNGHEITADVLKSDDQTVVIDFGFTVLAIPRGEVASIINDTESTEDSTELSNQESSGTHDWQLYRTAELPWSTIAENTKRFGEAVVMVTTPRGLGSGFIITPDGYLITNYHVVARETKITVVVFIKTDTGFEQKYFKKVKIIALNPYVDLAMLKIEEAEHDFRFTFLGHIDQIKTGDQVFAIGNPLGLTRTVSQGIVSTTNRDFEGRLYIQTTTDINPGNSGGPLFNLKGEVIGVTSMGYLFFGGLNFAIPVDVVQRFIENRDAFAYNDDNPNAGYRYQQPGQRIDKGAPPTGKLPDLD